MKEISKETMQKLLKLKKWEVLLGNLLPPEAELVQTVSDLNKKTETDVRQTSIELEKGVDVLFRAICFELQKASFSPLEISEAVNGVVNDGRKLKYCDEDEVKNALS